ncbi:DDE-type integrase/transposase/recombinase [Escherichia coli]|nr:DDE-type integrase/transposase/recombinase [Escherichia coli]MDO7748329.1 DDE-type integrase/transposase/recombinase [Escherichia coli]
MNASINWPDVLRAVAPNQVWSWDISYLPSWVRGQHFYLYMIVDIYSRKIIAAEVFASESGKHAAELLQRAVWNEKCSSNNLVLHSDNGGPMRSDTLLAKMYALGVLSSYSRRKRKLTAVCSHQTRIGNLDAHLI